LAVVVADGRDQALPAVSGTYLVEDGKLRFTPKYPFQPGLTYRVVLQLTDIPEGSSLPGSWLEADVVIPAATASRAETEVLQIYPSVTTLPENHLRFYIHFATAMARGEAYRHLELRDEQGRLVPDAFLELGEELWDRQAERFTLLLDPGRVKHALKPREELGPVLEAGRSYTLVVKAGWRDAAGNELPIDYRRQFRVGPAATEAIDYQKWNVSNPRAGTTDTLSIQFGRTLDRALAQRSITVRDQTEAIVAGDVKLQQGEQVWQFTPSVPWQETAYTLQIDPTLEDSAGNNLFSAFEVSPSPPTASDRRHQAVYLPIRLANVVQK
jgi:hypothetical protein